ncbi:MAG: thiosulfate oxidation carrier complex protein SoxZ [Gammaproteobacteria bacterium]|nr:MAG: thiosulfate oxidation carrier complex protein SoxZ [Gammaproteobacteria bacterium]
MAKTIKIRAKLQGDVTIVKMLIKHPMETGQRKDRKTGKKIPAHFIKEVDCKHNGSEVLTALWSGGISKNPYLAFKFKGGKKGDTISVKWVDNLGQSDSTETKIR